MGLFAQKREFQDSIAVNLWHGQDAELLARMTVTEIRTGQKDVKNVQFSEERSTGLTQQTSKADEDHAAPRKC